MRAISIKAVLGCALAMPMPQIAHAQETSREIASQYPSRPVTFVVPFAPGGVTSVFARLVGQRLEQKLEKPFIVENRPGGGGVTAATAVARAAPDGYTIMMASSTVLAINVSVRKNLTYDPRKELTPIALLARVPFVLVVKPGSAGALDRGAREARQGKARTLELRHAGARHLPSSQRRDVQEHVRRRSRARAL